MSANARPLTAILSRELGANLIYLNVIKKEVGCPQMRVLFRPFGAADQVRIFKKEVGCPQMRVLLQPF